MSSVIKRVVTIILNGLFVFSNLMLRSCVYENKKSEYISLSLHKLTYIQTTEKLITQRPHFTFSVLFVVVVISYVWHDRFDFVFFSKAHTRWDKDVNFVEWLIWDATISVPFFFLLNNFGNMRK